MEAAMALSKKFICLVLVTLFPFSSVLLAEKPDRDNTTVAIKVMNGGSGEAWSTNVAWHSGMNVLEALQSACAVETKPAGGYIFVTGINGTEGKRGDKAWYFEVNGVPSKTLASHTPVEAGDKMTWELKKDVCSCKVDGTNR